MCTCKQNPLSTIVLCKFEQKEWFNDIMFYGRTTIFFCSFCSGKMNLFITSSSSSRASWACSTTMSSGSERTAHFRARYRSNKTSLSTCRGQKRDHVMLLDSLDWDGFPQQAGRYRTRQDVVVSVDHSSILKCPLSIYWSPPSTPGLLFCTLASPSHSGPLGSVLMSLCVSLSPCSWCCPSCSSNDRTWPGTSRTAVTTLSRVLTLLVSAFTWEKLVLLSRCTKGDLNTSGLFFAYQTWFSLTMQRDWIC